MSVAKIIREYVNTNKSEVTLKQLHAEVCKTYPDKLEAQVYASAQQLVNQKSIMRTGKNYTKFVNQYKEVKETKKEEPKPISKRTKLKNKYSNQEVFDYLSENIGCKQNRPKDRFTYAVLLLGDYSPEYILNRGIAITEANEKELKWCVFNIGNNEVIGFFK